uniref:Uncharacterized protein n=1 Tax=Lactuca sativa TaxID=4236 RepID=A0A9R1VFF1_LACSA|nr:hypothetical protein LSAT_V11C500234260 [Lactuca sativa]
MTKKPIKVIKRDVSKVGYKEEVKKKKCGIKSKSEENATRRRKEDFKREYKRKLHTYKTNYKVKMSRRGQSSRGSGHGDIPWLCFSQINSKSSLVRAKKKFEILMRKEIYVPNEIDWHWIAHPGLEEELTPRARIIEDYGGGHIAIPNDDAVLAPEEPGRRVRPRHELVRENPPVIPVDDEPPMD